MWSVEMQRAASEKHSGFALRNRKIANVFAYLREDAPQQRAVPRQAVHQLIDVGRILQASLTHQHGSPRYSQDSPSRMSRPKPARGLPPQSARPELGLAPFR